MMGSRPLSDYEVSQVLSNLKNDRDKCLFILGVKTGLRISELLSIKHADCSQYGKINERITIARKNMKGKKNSRTIVLHEEAREALAKVVIKYNPGDALLFPFTRMQAHRILKDAMVKSELVGKVSSHALRKTFAKKMYHALKKDLVATQKALGHKSVNSTISYLSFEQSDIDNAIKGN